LYASCLANQLVSIQLHVAIPQSLPNSRSGSLPISRPRRRSSAPTEIRIRRPPDCSITTASMNAQRHCCSPAKGSREALRDFCGTLLCFPVLDDRNGRPATRFSINSSPTRSGTYKFGLFPELRSHPAGPPLQSGIGIRGRRATPPRTKSVGGPQRRFPTGLTVAISGFRNTGNPCGRFAGLHGAFWCPSVPDDRNGRPARYV
jgi:hypothetical protein